MNTCLQAQTLINQKAIETLGERSLVEVIVYLESLSGSHRINHFSDFKLSSINQTAIAEK
jgi:hypothetical protein